MIEKDQHRIPTDLQRLAKHEEKHSDLRYLNDAQDLLKLLQQDLICKPGDTPANYYAWPALITAIDSNLASCERLLKTSEQPTENHRKGSE